VEIAVLQDVLGVVRVADQAQRKAEKPLVVLTHDRFERGGVRKHRLGSRHFCRGTCRRPCGDRGFHCCRA